MARLAIVLVLAAPSPTYGDDDTTTTEEVERPPEHRWSVPGVLLPSQLDVIGAGGTTTTTRYDGPAGWLLELEGRSWSNRDDPDPLRPTIDVLGRGSSATARLSVDLGPVELEVTGSVVDLDTILGRGRYVDTGLAITKTRRLSRWMTAWISLGVGLRQWVGTVPDGESNGGQVTLTVGTTFR